MAASWHFSRPSWLHPDAVLPQTIERIVVTCGALFWALRCYVYILGWSIRNPLTDFLKKSATVFVAATVMWFIVEFVLTVFHVALIALSVPLWLKLAILAAAVFLA